MPCATVHLLTAGRTLAAWSEQPSDAPFDIRAPGLIRDFLSGAMAPDLGFVAAVDRTVSELVHYVETGSMVRALLRASRTQGETAFAWGWATHHLTDVLIHPLVGRAVGEVLYGDRERRVNASENEEVHVSVEVGLDIIIQHNHLDAPLPAPHETLAGGRLDVLAAALDRTYGIGFDADRLAGDFRLASRQIAAWPRVIRSLGRAWRINDPGRTYGPATLPFRLLGGLLPAGTAVRGLSRPRRPPEWLPRTVASLADEFAERFQESVRSGGAMLENRNLETGLLESQSLDHPGARVRRAWWESERRPEWTRAEPGPGN